MTGLAKQRPKHLNLFEIRQPLPAWTSILHRISGIGLFLMLPLLIWLLGLSLGSPDDYATFRSVTGHWFVKLILLGLLWAYLHHFCMGIRVLLLDLDIGTDLKPGRASAMAVLVVSLALTVILGAKLW
jgi:succinate dehydrogenase / fumarate reductase cytochrome b subunit